MKMTGYLIKRKIQLIQQITIAVFTIFLILSCSEDIDPVELDPPVNLRIFDIDNLNNASDIRVFFRTGNKAEFVSEYRIFLVKSTGASTFGISEAESLSTQFYTSLPAGTGDMKLNLSPGQTDSDGDQVINGNSYVAVALAIGNRADIPNVISESSSQLLLEDKPLFDLYISSSKRNSIELYDGVTGEHIKSFVSPGTGGLFDTQEVLFGKDGDMYVSSLGTSSILRFDGQTGALKGNFTSGYSLDLATKMNYGPDGFLYVSQWGNTKDAVVRFDTATGEFVDELVPSYFQGMDHAWDEDGSLYITSWGLADVRKYDSNGNFLSVLINTNLSGPVNLWIKGNDLFVVDWTEGNVKIFDKDNGSFRSIFISGLANVEGHVFDASGNLYLCDWQNDIVHKYDASGNLISQFINDDHLDTPNSITWGPNHRPK